VILYLSVSVFLLVWFVWSLWRARRRFRQSPFIDAYVKQCQEETKKLPRSNINWTTKFPIADPDLINFPNVPVRRADYACSRDLIDGMFGNGPVYPEFKREDLLPDRPRHCTKCGRPLVQVEMPVPPYYDTQQCEIVVDRVSTIRHCPVIGCIGLKYIGTEYYVGDGPKRMFWYPTTSLVILPGEVGE
jgi:hypothetical protein